MEPNRKQTEGHCAFPVSRKKMRGGSLLLLAVLLLLVKDSSNQEILQFLKSIGNFARNFNVALRIPRVQNEYNPILNFLQVHPDVGKPTPEMIARRGYKVETHLVRTSDGYILTMHRMPSKNRGGEPVFLQHGILSSSADWVQFGPEKSLVYLLHEYGYDVWMANMRGNTYSREHATMTTRDSAFWQYTFDEGALYDLPAEIDYVLEKTRFSQLTYIGHSMGTTMFFVLASSRPEYNAKIKQMHALSPVAYMSNVKTPIRLFTPFADITDFASSMLGANEFAPSNILTESLSQALCRDGIPTQYVCSNIMFLLFGFNSQQLNTTMLPVVFSHAPAGTSTKSILHYSQLIDSGRFCKYDYGALRNPRLYKSMLPPSYKLNRITVPVYLHYSENDWMSSEIDVNRLCKEIGNCKGMYKVPLKSFNHLDYLWAIDVRPLLYYPMLKLMQINQTAANVRF